MVAQSRTEALRAAQPQGTQHADVTLQSSCFRQSMKSHAKIGHSPDPQVVIVMD
jgi:hypothetical protein